MAKFSFEVDQKWLGAAEKLVKIRPEFNLPPEILTMLRANGQALKFAKPFFAESKLTTALALLTRAEKLMITDSIFSRTPGFTTISEIFIRDQAWFQAYLKSARQMEKLYSLASVVPPIFDLDPEFIKMVRYNLIPEPDTEEPVSRIILLDEGKKIKKIIKSVYDDHTELFRMEPRSFEEMIAELLVRQGFAVELTKQTRDGGYDLIAVQDLSGFPVKFLVECKRFAIDRKVNVNIIRSFSDVMNTEGSMGIVVTSSYFTRDAKIYPGKSRPWLLHYRDHDDVIRWVNQYVLPENM